MKTKVQTLAAIFVIPLLFSLISFQGTANSAKANNNQNDLTQAPLTGNPEYGREAQAFTITVNSLPSVDSGTVSKTPDKPSYELDEIVSLSATPKDGYKFVGWSGDLTGTDSPKDLVVSGNHTVNATFEARCYKLSLSHTGKGTDPLAVPSNSTGCNSGEYKVGTLITVYATPDTHWTVNNWTGTNNPSSNSSTNTVTMPASAHEVTVNYVPICFALNTTILPAGKGTISRSPATDADCPAGQYIEDTNVQLTATAVPESVTYLKTGVVMPPVRPTQPR